MLQINRGNTETIKAEQKWKDEFQRNSPSIGKNNLYSSIKMYNRHKTTELSVQIYNENNEYNEYKQTIVPVQHITEQSM